MVKLSGLNISMPMALALLMGSYYLFNIEYPPKGKNFSDAKKKIVIQQLLKELAA